MKKTRESHVVVFVTAPSKSEARRIAAVVLSNRLAACVNILDGIESHYWWNNKLERGSECLLLIKTTKRKMNRLAAAVKNTHSYQTPEIIALPVVTGSKEYLKWIADAVR
jgi:periplasmic divalent cation tolerance protein